MQRELIIKGRSLGGCSDLTLLAPIKPGFIDSLESVTYKTRIKRVLETLHGARMSAHEYHTAQLLSDAVERVGAIHSVRVAVLEPEDNVLLAVTFEGSWESYIRVLWDKVGSLLDLIFCGTVGYVTAYNHSFDQWHEWARSVQVETGFFYGPPEATARDVLFYERLGRLRVRGDEEKTAAGVVVSRPAASELDEVRAFMPSAEAAVDALTSNRVATEFGHLQPKPVPDVRMIRERIRNGLQGLAALYRLVDLHRPSTPDGDVLRHAALELLLEFVKMRDNNLITQQLIDEHPRFARQLDWLFPGPGRALMPRPKLPGSAADSELPLAARGDIQGGIVRTYAKVTHGVLLMLAFDTPEVARDFLRWLHDNDKLTTALKTHEAEPGIVFCNLGFTLAGLRAAGLDEDSLELFPEEFRQGMAARAGLLGDVRNNHPRRWRLPRRFDPATYGEAPTEAESIDMETVHAVLQLRCRDDSARALVALDLAHAAHPLRPEVKTLMAMNPKLRILATQALRRYYVPPIPYEDTTRDNVIVEHFGYVDGDGQPELKIQGDDDSKTPFDYNRIHPGELILGYENAADPAIDYLDPNVPEVAKARMRWLANGSFLAMRKYRQFVERFDVAIAATAAEMAATLPDLKKSIDDWKRIVKAKLMGRYADTGEPLAPHKAGTLNNFLYQKDPQGTACPLHAHIRRAHPRMPDGTSARPPRIMRRSMSYGPSRSANTSTDADRGLVFMAYNANLGEQFEVIQSWLAGGNSTGAASGVSCPLLGVPENGVPRFFRFEYKGHVFRIKLEDVDPILFEDPAVMTRLEWGLYLFVPSMGAINRLRSLAATGAAPAAKCPVPWRLARGRELVAGLEKIEATEGAAAALEAWKAVIEDSEAIDRLDSASMWAVLREEKGGVLKTPYGIIVADRELASEVYIDRQDRYSVCGQLERMKNSFGEISLGMDRGAVYSLQSTPINDAIQLLTCKDTFDVAFTAANAKLNDIVATANQQSADCGDARIEVGFEAREVVDEVLASLCEAWFGLQDDPRTSLPADSKKRLVSGSTDWAWKRGEPPLYPGHFTAMSRYMFQPHPDATVKDLGEHYGQALREAMRAFVEDHMRAGRPPKRPDFMGMSKQEAPIAASIFKHPDFGGDPDFVARNMVGVLMGFNPTIIGAVLNVVREWQCDDSFSALRAVLGSQSNLKAAKAVLDDKDSKLEDRAKALQACFDAADALLMKPMRTAAQMRPMPQIGWRTALKAHRLGTSADTAVDVAVGDRIILGMVSGTQQSLADGQPDCRLMFGGERLDPPTTPPTHPTHACPGYEAAMGAMLGTLMALLVRTETLRQGAAPLTFLIENDTKKPAPPPAVARAAAAPAPPRPTPPAPPADGKSLGLVLGWGDSWLDFRTAQTGFVGNDLRDWLKEFGYEAPADFCSWTSWPKSKTMADAPEKFCAFLRLQIQIRTEKPLAILLSAGGNDSTYDTLQNLLFDNPPPVAPLTGTPPAPGQIAFDASKLALHIKGLHDNYDTILKAIGKELVASNATDVPVLIHGYDYPLPWGLGGPLAYPRWMFDPFDRRKYKIDQVPADKEATRLAMRYLIDQLNEMLCKLPGEPGKPPIYPGMTIRYVDLRKTIEEHWQPGTPADWMNTAGGWTNDLHPTQDGFLLLAIKIHEILKPLSVAAAKNSATTTQPAQSATTSASP